MHYLSQHGLYQSQNASTGYSNNYNYQYYINYLYPNYYATNAKKIPNANWTSSVRSVKKYHGEHTKHHEPNPYYGTYGKRDVYSKNKSKLSQNGSVRAGWPLDAMSQLDKTESFLYAIESVNAVMRKPAKDSVRSVRKRQSRKALAETQKTEIPIKIVETHHQPISIPIVTAQPKDGEESIRTSASNFTIRTSTPIDHLHSIGSSGGTSPPRFAKIQSPLPTGDSLADITPIRSPTPSRQQPSPVWHAVSNRETPGATTSVSINTQRTVLRPSKLDTTPPRDWNHDLNTKDIIDDSDTKLIVEQTRDVVSIEKHVSQLLTTLINNNNNEKARNMTPITVMNPVSHKISVVNLPADESQSQSQSLIHSKEEPELKQETKKQDEDAEKPTPSVPEPFLPIDDKKETVTTPKFTVHSNDKTLITEPIIATTTILLSQLKNKLHLHSSSPLPYQAEQKPISTSSPAIVQNVDLNHHENPADSPPVATSTASDQKQTEPDDSSKIEPKIDTNPKLVDTRPSSPKSSKSGKHSTKQHRITIPRAPPILTSRTLKSSDLKKLSTRTDTKHTSVNKVKNDSATLTDRPSSTLKSHMLVTEIPVIDYNAYLNPKRRPSHYSEHATMGHGYYESSQNVQKASPQTPTSIDTETTQRVMSTTHTHDHGHQVISKVHVKNDQPAERKQVDKKEKQQRVNTVATVAVGVSLGEPVKTIITQIPKPTVKSKPKQPKQQPDNSTPTVYSPSVRLYGSTPIDYAAYLQFPSYTPTPNPTPYPTMMQHSAHGTPSPYSSQTPMSVQYSNAPLNAFANPTSTSFSSTTTPTHFTSRTTTPYMSTTPVHFTNNAQSPYPINAPYGPNTQTPIPFTTMTYQRYDSPPFDTATNTAHAHIMSPIDQNFLENSDTDTDLSSMMMTNEYYDGNVSVYTLNKIHQMRKNDHSSPLPEEQHHHVQAQHGTFPRKSTRLNNFFQNNNDAQQTVDQYSYMSVEMKALTKAQFIAAYKANNGDLATQIVAPYLYLGGHRSVTDISELISNGITHVLNVAHEIPLDHSILAHYNIKVLNISARDAVTYNIRLEFERAFNFIDDALHTGGKIIVNCALGISRSATIVVAYLMYKYKMSLSDAYKLILSQRPQVRPNRNFRRQLELYEHELLLNNHNQRT